MFDSLRLPLSLTAAVFSLATPFSVAAADTSPGPRQIELVAKDGQFSPTVIAVAAGEKFELVIKNEGHEAEEFESIDLKREKVVPPGKSVTIKIGPLKDGSYTFFGDFHPETARGKIEVK